MNRNYGLDLSKIFAMFLIILSHILYPGGVMESIVDIDRFVILNIFRILSLSCINIFALATGYLSINKTSIKTSKIIKLLINVMFYSVFITLIIILINPNKITINYIIKSIDIGSYWYLKAYVALYLLLPFINKLIRSISIKEYKIIIYILLFLSFFPFDYFGFNYGYSVWWLIVMYLLGGFIKKSMIIPKKRITLILIINIFIMEVVNVVFFKTQNSVIKYVSNYLYSYTCPLIVGNSIIIFLLFKDIIIKNEIITKIISFISPSVFYVYIIHFQYVFAWEYFINRFKILNSFNIALELLYIFFIMLFIFIVCIIIDKIKDKIFKFIGIEKIIIKICKKFDFQITLD